MSQDGLIEGGTDVVMLNNASSDRNNNLYVAQDITMMTTCKEAPVSRDFGEIDFRKTRVKIKVIPLFFYHGRVLSLLRINTFMNTTVWT